MGEEEAAEVDSEEASTDSSSTNTQIEKYVPWDPRKQSTSVGMWEDADGEKVAEYVACRNKENRLASSLPGYTRDHHDAQLDRGRISKAEKKKKRGDRKEAFWNAFGAPHSNPFHKLH
uniref:Uncharacterized protein n=2 Tax=Lygus hesperus TaxID=30085 RepID=A0A146LBZ5_LYGHE